VIVCGVIYHIKSRF